MLTALTIISLLSLLVATEAEPTSSRVERATEQPLRPTRKDRGPGDGNSDRLAA